MQYVGCRRSSGNGSWPWRHVMVQGLVSIRSVGSRRWCKDGPRSSSWMGPNQQPPDTLRRGIDQRILHLIASF